MLASVSGHTEVTELDRSDFDGSGAKKQQKKQVSTAIRLIGRRDQPDTVIGATLSRLRQANKKPSQLLLLDFILPACMA